MATLSLAHRLLAGGSFAVAAAAAPLMIALGNPAGPASPALADCPITEVLDPVSGACRPIQDVTAPTLNPINPENTSLQPGGITSGQAGDVGELPAVDGIPCTGGNTGQCIGLEQSQGAHNNVHLPQVPVGVTP